MCFGLAERAAVLDGHCLPDDEFRQFRVGSVDSSVIDIECVTLGGLDNLNLGSLGHHARLGAAHEVEHLLEPADVFLVARGGLCDAHGHAEYLSERVPEAHGVLFGDGLLCRLEVEAEVVRLSGFDDLVGERCLMVVEARVPVIAQVLDHTVVFGNHVAAVDERHAVESEQPVLGADHIAQFDE